MADRLTRCWTGPLISGVDLGFPPGDGPLLGAGMQGIYDAVAGDAEVSVLDVDGDDLPGVGGSHAQPLAIHSPGEATEIRRSTA
jgi:hypothetical protein